MILVFDVGKDLSEVGFSCELVHLQELTHAPPHLVADTAHRLALRLKRRVAFERKMLARTASGRRRGAA